MVLYMYVPTDGSENEDANTFVEFMRILLSSSDQIFFEKLKVPNNDYASGYLCYIEGPDNELQKLCNESVLCTLGDYGISFVGVSD